jgi:hypothetical protein
MTKDALKFFQNYVLEMIDIGGANLPKSISASLGAKLGKIYKKRGITGIEQCLAQSYKVLNATSNIQKIDENTLRVKLKYKKKFCPIGGKYNPEKAEAVHQSVCIPYTLGLLTEVNPNFKYVGEILECNLKSNKGVCEYTLKLEEKEDKS